MSESKLLRHHDWEMQVTLNTGPFFGGLILSDVQHHSYFLARDIRVVRIWAGTDDPRTGTAPKSFVLGDPDQLPAMSGLFIEDASSADKKLIFPHVPVRKAWADFETAEPVFPGGRKLAITQSYILTDYTKSPPHEPGHVLTAARLYPLVKFFYPGGGEQPDKAPLKYLRVDYRFEFSIDRLPNAPDEIRKARAGGPWNQAGVFLDRETYTPPLTISKQDPSTPAPTSIEKVFQAGEKPIQWDLIGQGLRHGRKADWDNIHQWAAPPAGFPDLPVTPGAFHAVHTHWRWGAITVAPPAWFASLAGIKGGPQFGGVGGAGGPLIDPRIPDQNIRLAIAALQADPGYGVSAPATPPKWTANQNSSTAKFDDLFTGTRAPASIGLGARLTAWISFEAFRGAESIAKNESWKGTFFVHGLYFAHEPETFLTRSVILGGLKGALQQPPLPAKPVPWVRPPSVA